MGNFNSVPVPRRRRDYYIIAWMITVHTLAVAALAHASWAAVAVMAVLSVATGGLGVALGFHRLLSHHSFKAARWVECTLATLATLALEGGPIEWIAHHRMHHAGTDTPRDPHNAANGFWYSHFAWLTWRTPDFDDPRRLHKFARDMVADPYFRWLSDYRVMVGIQLGLAAVLLALGGISFVLWGVFARLAVVYHVTWLVNSAAHRFGYRNHATSDQSTNCWWVSLLALGEGWHNNHHAAPEYAHVQHRWWEFDVLWQVTRLLEAAGQVWDIKRPPAALTTFTLPPGRSV